jgi:hypothetical protein
MCGPLCGLARGNHIIFNKIKQIIDPLVEPAELAYTARLNPMAYSATRSSRRPP